MASRRLIPPTAIQTHISDTKKSFSKSHRRTYPTHDGMLRKHRLLRPCLWFPVWAVHLRAFMGTTLGGASKPHSPRGEGVTRRAGLVLVPQLVESCYQALAESNCIPRKPGLFALRIRRTDVRFQVHLSLASQGEQAEGWVDHCGGAAVPYFSFNRTKPPPPPPPSAGCVWWHTPWGTPTDQEVAPGRALRHPHRADRLWGLRGEALHSFAAGCRRSVAPGRWGVAGGGGCGSSRFIAAGRRRVVGWKNGHRDVRDILMETWRVVDQRGCY